MPRQSRDLERPHLWKPKPVRELIPPDPPLQDDVVLLRPPEPADADALLPIRSEEDTRRWMLWDDEPLPDHDEILANIERAQQSWAEGTWAVFVITVNGEIVGGANLGYYEHDIAEGSYFLAGAERGRATRRGRFGFSRSGPSRRTGSSASSCASTRETRRRSGWPTRRIHARGNRARIPPGDGRLALRLSGVLAAPGRARLARPTRRRADRR